jgi:hypothetical protein
MSITRRHILAAVGSSILSRMCAGTVSGVGTRAGFDLDRLLNVNSAATGDAESRSEVCKYVANATITLFSIPLVSKNAVGSGYAVVEQAGRTVAIQFGAGSWPESARGLNRLGFIQEGVMEERPGYPAECAWLAFMTTSQEKNLDQAKKALEKSGGMVPYSASQGYGRRGSFSSRVDRLEFPGRYTWRDINSLVGKAREEMAEAAGEEEKMTSSAERPGTFLYMVRSAMLDGGERTTGRLVFNRKEYQLDTRKEPDASAAAYFAARSLISAAGSVIRMDATLTRKADGDRTPFRLWYETGAAPALPLRFEYQAKSFLRLTFEANAKAATPPIESAFKTSREAA